MTAFYNEIDPYAAQWLRNLIASGRIAPGVVDERSIEDIPPDELRPYTQCHFFAGIGAWSLALRLAGWPDDRPVWTGSCPCQPFSAAGKGAGFADERHLWPAFHYLINQCRPPVVFGEQVASKDGLDWLDLVQDDLEGSGYASAASDLCAAGVGAPHIRQRLYWVADANGGASWRDARGLHAPETQTWRLRFTDGLESAGAVCVNGMADADDAGLEGRVAVRQRAGECAVGQDGVVGGFGNTDEIGRQQFSMQFGNIAEGVGSGRGEPIQNGSTSGGAIATPATRPTNGHWRDADWLFCRDGKWRPVEPGTFPLAHGATSRVGRLRAYGNAIVPQVAQTFIEAYLGR